MTQKRIKSKSKVRISLHDVVVTVGCLAVFGTSLFLFWKDLNKTYNRSDRDSIATITFKYKVAQRKFSDRVVWERLQQSSPLYNEDTIRTADLAEAIVTFKDGTKLEIHENSMIQIFQAADGSVRLNVNDGGVEVDTSESKTESAVALQMDNGTVVNLENGSRLAANSVEGESNFQLKSGSGTIIAAEGVSNDQEEPVVLVAGETAKIDTSGVISKRPITVTSISNDLRILNFDEDKPVTVKLAWTAAEEVSEVKVETSLFKDFQKIEKTFTVSDSTSIDLSAENGTMYWRIYENEKLEDGAAGRIRVEPVTAVQLRAPLNQTEYKSHASFPQINFNWLGNSYAEKYKIEVSKSADFSNIILEKDVENPSFSYSEFDEGTYFWRVTPYYSLNNIGYNGVSSVNSFSLVHKELAGAPVAVLPAENATLFYVENALNTSFRWKSDVSECEYDLLISSDESFKNVVYSKRITENRLMEKFTTESLPLGNYFWKVIRHATEEEKEAESAVQHFRVSVYVPGKNRLVYPPENYTVEKSKLGAVNFAWRLADELKNSNKEIAIQFAKDAAFSEISKEFTLTDLSLTNLTLENGKYFWRIGVYDDFSQKIEYTEARTFTVLAELRAPVIIMPFANQTLVCNAANSITASWQIIPEADLYSVKLVDSSYNVLQEKTSVKETRTVFAIDEKIKAMLIDKKSEQFGIVVQPYCEATDVQDMRLGPTSVQNFSLRNINPVVLEAPATGKIFDGLNVLYNPIEFSWKSGEDVPAKQTFELQKLQSTGNWKTVETRENSKTSVSLTGLNEGSYRWIVKASLADGTAVNAVDYFNFKINGIPELQLPVLVQPENGFVMDTKYLRKNRKIEFSWQEVDGATEYEISIFKKNGTKLEHIKTEKVKNNSFRFSELKKLDVGEFEWQVTAYSIGKKGSENAGKVVQQSKVSKGSFKIDFQLPGKIRAKDPGEIFVD